MMELYYNGKLYGTPGPDTAMAVKNGVILATGTDEEILRMDDGTDSVTRTDLAGQLVLPGFVDSHMHMLHYALEKSYVDLSAARSFADVRETCLAALPSRAPAPLRGTGFNQNDWDIPELPTRADLDTISTDVPVILIRTCHHITVCNTPTLELAGLTQRFPDGILREAEQNIIEEALPPLTKDEVKDLIRFATAEAASKGITEIQTDDLILLPHEEYGQTVLAAYRELDEAGELPIRIYEQCNIESPDHLQAFLDAGNRTGLSTGNFTIGPLKILGDGALGARTAAMTFDYPGNPGNQGILNFTDEQLLELCHMAHRAGMQIAIHGIGDRCIQQILDAFAQIQQECPRTDPRHGIVHCQITHPEQLRQMHSQNVMAYIQPVFLRADQHIAEDRIGKSLAATSYDWRTMKDLGIHLAGGSDCPVEPYDILPNIWYAVMRRDPEGSGGTEPAESIGNAPSNRAGSTTAPWFPENALTLDEAICAFTREGAYASFSEQTRGRLTAGFTADFCVLDHDITALPPESLLMANATMTVVGGKVVYRR